MRGVKEPQHSQHSSKWPCRNLKIRKLSCYCEKCLDCKYDECTNTEYVENWEQIQLESERVERRATRTDMNEQRKRIVDLISANSNVAIASGDVEEDYYLLIRFQEMVLKFFRGQLKMIGV